MRTQLCFCAEIPTLTTQVELVVLRHQMETFKSTNTARYAALAIPRLKLVEYGRPYEPLDSSLFSAPGTALLFPGGSSNFRPQRLIIPDGSWSQARRMVQRIPVVQTLPRFSLGPPPKPLDRLRREHLAEGMTTLESIVAALELLGEVEVADALRIVNRRHFEQVQKSKGAWATIKESAET